MTDACRLCALSCLCDADARVWREISGASSMRVRVLHTAAVALVFALGAAGAQARDLYRWVQYAPGGVEARAVTSDPACPPAIIDGISAAMQERSAPAPGYPVRGCVLP